MGQRQGQGQGQGGEVSVCVRERERQRETHTHVPSRALQFYTFPNQCVHYLIISVSHHHMNSLLLSFFLVALCGSDTTVHAVVDIVCFQSLEIVNVIERPICF